jgi:RNA polymerase sigma factor (sigma-70 family)
MRLPVWKQKSMIAGAAVEARSTGAESRQRAMFLRLMAEYEPALRRLAAAYAEAATDRDDLFQEIAVAIWQAAPRFRRESSERTWLYRIAHNVSISAAAKLRRIERKEEAIPEWFDHASTASDAEQALLRAEKRRLLIDCIRDLPAVDRQIILLHLEGLSYAEIEEVSGFSETAVATRLSRVREKIRQEIQRKRVSRQ